jgi:hypothetical protein
MASEYPNASVPLLLALQQSPLTVPRTFVLISSDGTCLPLCLLSLLTYFAGAHRAYAHTLARFLVFFGIWTGRPVTSVQDCLCQTLVDKAPLSGRASILEAFLLWIADSVESPGVALIPQPRSFLVLTSHLTSYLMQTSFSTPACTSNTFCAGRRCCTVPGISCPRGRVPGVASGSLPSFPTPASLLRRFQAVL